MAKFWYKLVNENANMSVKLAANSTVVFSKRLGEVEFLLEENAILDAMVAKNALSKKTDAERKISSKKVEAPKPVVKAEAPKAEAPKAEAPKAEAAKPEVKAEAPKAKAKPETKEDAAK